MTTPPADAFQRLHQKNPVYQATIDILGHQSLGNNPKTVTIIKSLVNDDAVIPVDLMSSMISYYLNNDLTQIWADLIGVEYLTLDGQIKEVDLDYLINFTELMKPKVLELIQAKQLFRQVDF